MSKVEAVLLAAADSLTEQDKLRADDGRLAAYVAEQLIAQTPEGCV